jgi:hypothetical protein
MINKKSKIFFILLIVFISVSLAITYYKYVILNDFETITDEVLFNESLGE